MVQSYCVAFYILSMKLPDLVLIYLPPPNGETAPSRPRAPHYRGFLITLRSPHSVGLLWPSDQQNAYLTTHNTHKRQISTPSAGFETAVPTSEKLQTQALDRTATGIGFGVSYSSIFLQTPRVFEGYGN
jgi:hypothetical protein